MAGDDRLRNLQRQLAKIQSGMNALAGDEPTPTFREFAGDHLRQKLAHPSLRPSTKRAFEQQVRNHLVPAFGHLHLNEITPKAWLAWIEKTRKARKARGLTRFFMSRKVLIEILNAAKESGLIEKLPKLENPDVRREVGRALSDSEIIRILRGARRPFRFVFYCFWKMGCRPREILKWEWSMIRWNDQGMSWLDIPARISKTDRSRSIPLNPGVTRILRIRHRLGNGSPFVFQSRNSQKPQLSYHAAWRSAGKRSGVSALPYDLRRTFITRCAAENRPLLYVAKALDTSTKMIESVYAKAQADVMEAIIK